MAEQNQNNRQAQEPDLNQIRKNKREKLANLQSEGNDPFVITTYDQTHRDRRWLLLWLSHDGASRCCRSSPFGDR